MFEKAGGSGGVLLHWFAQAEAGPTFQGDTHYLVEPPISTDAETGLEVVQAQHFLHGQVVHLQRRRPGSNSCRQKL